MRRFSNTNLETLKEELDKCELLCSNCHHEYHNLGLSLDNVSKIILNSSKTSFSNPSGNVCPVCGERFSKVTGKIYCSEQCKWKDKGYPSLDEVNRKYEELKSWEKVAKSFGLTRKIIQGIRKRNS